MDLRPAANRRADVNNIIPSFIEMGTGKICLTLGMGSSKCREFNLGEGE
jgi:hypothetical protein